MTTHRSHAEAAGDNQGYAPSEPPRIGAVSYLNSKPLIAGLAESGAGRLLLDYPSRLADSLAKQALDVALIPSIEIMRSRGAYEIVSDACIAARGPVRSVKVYFRASPGDVKTLALDEGSRTSAALAQVLLAHKFGSTPKTVPLHLGRGIEQTTADAVLLIGDRAMYPVAQDFETIWDLGEQWRRWTGLPFVFAAWAARADIPAGHRSFLTAQLARARDRGLAEIDEIVARESHALDLDRETVHEYLTRNLHFTLGPAEISGLKLFAELAAESNLAPKGTDLVFHERTGTDSDNAGPGRGSDPRKGDGRDKRRLVGAR